MQYVIGILLNCDSTWSKKRKPDNASVPQRNTTDFLLRDKLEQILKLVSVGMMKLPTIRLLSTACTAFGYHVFVLYRIAKLSSQH